MMIMIMHGVRRGCMEYDVGVCNTPLHVIHGVWRGWHGIRCGHMQYAPPHDPWRTVMICMAGGAGDVYTINRRSQRNSTGWHYPGVISASMQSTFPSREGQI